MSVLRRLATAAASVLLACAAGTAMATTEAVATRATTPVNAPQHPALQQLYAAADLIWLDPAGRASSNARDALALLADAGVTELAVFEGRERRLQPIGPS